MFTRSRILVAAAVCALAGSALAWPGSLAPASTRPGGPAAAPVTGPAALPAPAPAASKTPAPVRMDLECVKGFSKDYCGGIVAPGQDTFTACPGPAPSCKTLRITGATLDITLVSNRLACGDTSSTTCDESPDGRLKVTSDFTIRLQPNCPYRGCWQSNTNAEFTDANGVIYRGTLLGTIGVGTHRLWGTTVCSRPPLTRNCERCYDVSFDVTSSLWRIGYEAAYHGVADTGEEVCFSLSGDFQIEGDAFGGPFWANIWKVYGTADGTHLTFCP